MYVIKKIGNYLYAIKKLSSHSCHCSKLFLVIYAISLRFDSNGVKPRVWKVKNTLKLNM